jgi:hypothetical protein
LIRPSHVLWGIAAGAILPRSNAAAADKASLACIQASDEGQTARDSGNLLRARELFAKCADPKCPAMIRRDCTSWVEKVEPHIPSIVVGARDAQGHDVLDATVTVDGQPVDKAQAGPLELNPGPHLVRWEGVGEPVEMRIALRPQEKNRAVIATLTRPGGSPGATTGSTNDQPAQFGADKGQEPASSGGLPAASYVFGGVGVAALGVFTYFGLRAKHDSNALHDGCAPGCSHADVQALKTKMLLADVALGVGIVGIAAATFFAIRGESAPKSAWQLDVAPEVGGASARIDVRF